MKEKSVDWFFLAGKQDPFGPGLNEDLMIIELNDNEARLLYTVLLEQAQEHLSYANTSEVAERLYRLATRFEHPVTANELTIA